MFRECTTTITGQLRHYLLWREKCSLEVLVHKQAAWVEFGADITEVVEIWVNFSQSLGTKFVSLWGKR